MSITLDCGTESLVSKEDVVLSNDFDETSWDSFVRSHASGSLYHLSAWQKLVSDVFPHRPHHIVARNRHTREIIGIMPLFYVHSRIFGRMLISTPYASYGGILSNSDAVGELILQRARELARDLNVEFLELRNFRNAQNDDTLLRKDLYFTFRKELLQDPELMLNSIPKKTRYEIREGIKNGLEFRVNAIGPDEFYDVYSQNVRLLGTPVFPRQIMTKGLEHFGSDCKLFSVHWKGKLVSAAWTVFYKDEFLPHFACALREYNHLSVNNFMYWMLMRYGAENGYKTFDFGRSKQGTGSFAFKKHWGMTITGLDYQYALVRRQSLPDTSPLNPKFSMSIEVWRRLPLAVTKLIGPQISRHLI